jgi:hypothetical protein
LGTPDVLQDCERENPADESPHHCRSSWRNREVKLITNAAI